MKKKKKETHVIKLLHFTRSYFKERTGNKKKNTHSQESRGKHGEVVPYSHPHSGYDSENSFGYLSRAQVLSSDPPLLFSRSFFQFLKQLPITWK